METSPNAGEGCSESQEFLFTVAKRTTHNSLKSMISATHELIPQPAINWPHPALFPQWTPSTLSQQDDYSSLYDCKQSTLSQASSSPAVCLSIARCLSRCNSRMSQSPAPVSSPLFGSSAECFNCPGAGGWIALQHAQSTANSPKLCPCQGSQPKTQFVNTNGAEHKVTTNHFHQKEPTEWTASLVVSVIILVL